MAKDEEQEETDVPAFRIVVVAELAPRAKFRVGERADPTAIPVDDATLDELMDRVATTFAIEVEEGSKRTRRIELEFSSLRSLTPEGLADSITKSAKPAKIDATALAALVGSALAHPEVQRLEQVWRSLKLLLAHAPKEKGVEVFAIAADKSEKEGVLDALAESDTDAFDLVVLDEIVTSAAADMGRAKRAAAVAASMNAPVLISTDTSLAAARKAAADESMRWLFVSTNGPLVRGPYAGKGKASVAFDQKPTEPGAWVAALSAFALAALCAKSFAATAWPTPVTAPVVSLEGLVKREAVVDGKSCAIAVETFLDDEADQNLAEAGVIAFRGIANRDSAYVQSTPSMFRPTKGANAEEGNLADALFVGALVRGLRELAAAIPEGTPPAKVAHAAEAIVKEMFATAPAPRPDVTARAAGDRLELVVRAQRFAGVSLEELSLDVPLG